MRRAFALVLTLLVAGLGAALSAPEAVAPDAFFAPLGASLAPTAPAAASNGAEPSILVAQDGAIYIGDTSGLVKSTDNGASWRRVNIGFVGGLFTDGWSIAEDDMGVLYVAVTNGQMLSVASSADAGATWSVNHLVDASTIADRPWIAARGDGEVAVIYNDGKTTRELCVHSTDGGLTFLTRYIGIQASPNGGNLRFGPDGALYYAVGTLTNRWATPCVGEPQKLIQGNPGSQIFMQVDVNDAGDIFVAKPTPGNGQMLVVGTHGMSRATTRTVVVSPPDSRSNTFGTISAGADGKVAAAWYGSATPGSPSSDGFSGSWNVYVATIDDFWGTPVVTTSVVSPQPNHVGGFCFAGVACTTGDRDLLDYFMIDHGPDGSVHVAYGHDGSGSNSEVRYARVAP